ncbi:MAG: transposase [Bacteroidota bacterium]|nr:transposase [Bacteroidota bacterium]
MASRYNFGDSTKPLFITFSVIDLIDVFTRETYKRIPVESLAFCMAEKGSIIHAWAIMSNHVHLILSAREGFEPAAIINEKIIQVK